MKNKKYSLNKHQKISDDVSGLLFQQVNWTEDGILQLGTVTGIYSMKGINYLTVMTIFGKLRQVKPEKVSRFSVQARA
ncbi:MAG: hypothetical protein RBU28_02830 [Bacteroidales bacterium]|jgi:hypothetical protein|nr:hypothetical protein [Bacteroidales bacterium]